MEEEKKKKKKKKKKKTRNECRLSIDDMSVCASRDSTAGLVSWIESVGRFSELIRKVKSIKKKKKKKKKKCGGSFSMKEIELKGITLK